MQILLFCFDIKWQGLPGTDWIQAIGAFIAIVAGIVGFVSLFRKDKNKQQQINCLIKLAEQAERQANQSTTMVDYLRKSNNLLSEQIQVLQTISQAWMQSRETDMKQIDIQTRVHKHSMLPWFEQGDTQGVGSDFRAKLRNRGETAYLKGIEVLPDSKSSNIRLISAGNETIPSSGILKIEMINAMNVSFKVLFTDVEGNLYAQHVHGNPLKLQIDLPEEQLKN